MSYKEIFLGLGTDIIAAGAACLSNNLARHSDGFDPTKHPQAIAAISLLAAGGALTTGMGFCTSWTNNPKFIFATSLLKIGFLTWGAYMFGQDGNNVANLSKDIPNDNQALQALIGMGIAILVSAVEKGALACMSKPQDYIPVR